MEENSTNGVPSRQMFQGDWICSECSQPINKLPFQPKEGQTLSCKDCYIKKRGSRAPARLSQTDVNESLVDFIKTS